MDSGKMTLAERCDGLMLNTYHQATEVILTGRNAELSPSLTSQGKAYLDMSLKDYITQLISTWKKNITAPLVIDLYLYDNDANESLLMERWKFVYNRNEDSRDGRFATIQKKVITFIRSLYCFVRLLPGFQLLKLSPKLVNINCTVYNPDKNGVQSSFLHETITYQFPQLLNSKGVLLVEVKYTNGINLQKLLRIQSKLTILTSPISKGGNNYTPQSYKSNATPIPIPVTSGTSSPFTPQYLSPENQKSRSSSIDNEYTDYRIRSSSNSSGVGANSNKLSTPQRNSIQFTPPKASNISDKKPPLYPDSGYTSINSSPNAYPPFMMQQNVLHTGQSPTMLFMNNLIPHDETVQGLSPPFPQSFNLLSTSPNVGNGVGNNSYSIHSYRESLRRASFERMKQSATQQLLELNINLKVSLPISPFVTKVTTDTDALDDKVGKSIPIDNNKDRESIGGTKDRESVGERERLSSVDDDTGDASFAFEEEMPFAWGQTEGIIPFASNNNTQPIAKLCIAPPALISFSEGITDQCINETSLMEHIKQLEEFRKSLN